MNRFRVTSFLLTTCLPFLATGFVSADPHPGELLKFYQMPLNNGATPYLAPAPPSHPNTPGYGSVLSTAFFPGHDESSTARRTAPSPDAPWEGTYMADDFADYANTPVTHIRWWGSYIGQQPSAAVGGVKRFLISFEHNIRASTGPNGELVPSHPDFNHPGNLHQIVTIAPPLAPPPPGRFTEKPLLTPVLLGGTAPREPLFEYNAELHLDKWFYQKAAEAGANNVYWLKIVALNDVQQEGFFDWGWHNRDWSIPNALAAKPGDTPDGAERDIGPIPVGGGLRPLWHFEDDAVTGGIIISPNPTMPFMPSVQQTSFDDENYLPPWDGPSQIFEYSKDLAFELYTRVPEPTAAVLLMTAIACLLGVARRNR